MNQNKTLVELSYPEVYFEMPEKKIFLNPLSLEAFSQEQEARDCKSGLVVFCPVASIFRGANERLVLANKYNQAYAELLD